MKSGEHVANIGGQGRRRRAIGGVVWFALGVGALVWLDVQHAPAAMHLVLLVPFFMAALGWLQARERT